MTSPPDTPQAEAWPEAKWKRVDSPMGGCHRIWFGEHGMSNEGGEAERKQFESAEANVDRLVACYEAFRAHGITEPEAALDALVAALRMSLKIIDHANPGAWSNGNTDPSGSMDEGEVLTGRALERCRAALAYVKEQR